MVLLPAFISFHEPCPLEFGTPPLLQQQPRPSDPFYPPDLSILVQNFDQFATAHVG